MSVKYLNFSFLPKNLTLSSPLPALTKELEEIIFLKNCLKGLVPLFITELPNLVMAHTGGHCLLAYIGIRLDD